MFGYNHYLMVCQSACVFPCCRLICYCLLLFTGRSYFYFFNLKDCRKRTRGRHFQYKLETESIGNSNRINIFAETEVELSMNWLIFWIAVFLLMMIVLTIKYMRSGTLESYLVNNRNTGMILLVFTTLATFVGGGTSIGLISMGYQAGFAATGVGVAYFLGFFLVAWYAPRIHRAGVKFNIFSFPQYLNHAFGVGPNSSFSRWFSTVVTGVNIFIFFFLLAAQFVGMASLLKYAFGLGYITAAVISCVIVIFYTAMAGLAGVILTDMVQFIVIVLMMIVIFIPGIWADTNGLAALGQLPSEMLNGTMYGWAFLIGLPLFIAPSVLVRMDIWQRLLAARSEKVARKAALWSGFGMLPFYLLFPLVGMAMRVQSGDTLAPDDTTFLFLSRHSTNGLLAFSVVGLMSALMSSGDSFLNIISISAVNDLKGWGIGEMTSQVFFRMLRVAAILFGMLALILALLIPDIVNLMVVGLGTISIFVPITLLALIDKEPLRYRKSALASILSGFAVNVLFFILGVSLPRQYEAKSSFVPAFVVAGIVLVSGVFLTRLRNREATGDV